ncbi:MAG TPA: septum formation initiator family protein [Arthrobacter sp.]|nr:septum formation initiator family protein [Arthrobacter sp.]
MATRRPKVPRAASGRPAATAATEAAKDSADVIRAEFGGAKEGAKGKAATANGAGAPKKDTPTSASKTRGSGAAVPATGGKPKGAPARDAVQDYAHDDGHPVPAKAFSGRMLALAVVMIAITIMLAPTVKIFFDKRAEIAALNADIAASQAEQDSLRQQVSRWQDPNYVKQQARDRINMVMPGETGYWVFGSDLPAGSSSSQSGAAAQDPADLPWVDSLWESIRRAATD